MHHTNSNFPTINPDVNARSNNGIPKKRSVKSYATKVFQESTVGIISSVFTTHSKYRRFCKVFLSSFCIAGFIYHCDMFLNHVFGYPEVVNFSLETPETYNMPAYTYCNNNPIRRSAFCGKYSEYCEEPSEEFCQKYSAYCGTNVTIIPKKEYFYNLPYDLQHQKVLKYSDPYLSARIKSFIRRSTKTEDEISGPYLRLSGSHVTGKACYTIHSRVESDRQPVKKKRKDEHTPWVDEWIRFYVDETEMMNPTSNPGVFFAVHSPFEAVNPLTKGIFLKGGRTYRLYVEMVIYNTKHAQGTQNKVYRLPENLSIFTVVRPWADGQINRVHKILSTLLENVKKEEEVLLEAPFESNCMDYDELWIKNNSTGPRTKKMCREKCYLDNDIFRYECVSPHNDYPHKQRLCDTLSRPVPRNFSFSVDECLKKCRDECRSSTYSTEVSIQDYVDNVDLEEQHRHIEVLIYLSNDEVKVLRHSPKYETVDIISSVGGFMGCWIGIGVMDILDVFGSFVTVCKYAFRKKL